MTQQTMKVRIQDNSYVDVVLHSSFQVVFGTEVFTFALHQSCGSGNFYRVSELLTGTGIGDVLGPKNHLVMVDDEYSATDLLGYAEAAVRDTERRAGAPLMLGALRHNKEVWPIVNPLEFAATMAVAS